MKIPGSSISLLLLTGLLCCGAQARDTAPSDAPIFISQLSQVEVQSHIREIEDAFFARFNALTNNDHLKVRCRARTPPLSRIRHRSCEPIFQIRARFDYWSTIRSSSNLGKAREARRAKVAEYSKLFEAELNRLIAEDSTLREFNDVLAALLARLAELET